jgi:hypothetical protein
MACVKALPRWNSRWRSGSWYPAGSYDDCSNLFLEYEIICGHPMAQMDFHLDVGSTGLSRWKSDE